MRNDRVEVSAKPPKAWLKLQTETSCVYAIIMMDVINLQTSQVVVRALCKYETRDYRFSRFYQQRQKLSVARAFLKQSDFLNNLINNIMFTEKNSFEAKVIEVKNSQADRYLRYVNMDNGEEGTVPEWCITSFVILPDECLDASGHIVKGATLELREMENGKIYPGKMYKRRDVPLQKPSLIVRTKKMSKESLYEDVKLYKPVSLTDLWQTFETRLRNNELTADAVMQTLEIKGNSTEKEQHAWLCKLLGVATFDLGVQEKLHQEFKMSFLHSANPLRTERSCQNQQIFKEIAAFANSHEPGDVFVGVENDGKIHGVEEELLNEAPFDNRADFQADFINQLHQAVDNFSFVSTVKMTWYKTVDEKLFCRISVPKWDGDIILLNGCELYVRVEACKKQLKNADLINYVLSNSRGKAA